MGDSAPAGSLLSPAAATATLQQLLNGAVITQALYVAAKLGIADRLMAGSKSSAELALAAGAHAPSLHRLLRFLVSLGVFAQTADEHFELTPVSQLLRREVDGSLWAAAVYRGEPWVWAPWGSLLHSVQTGQPAFDHVHGMGLWEYTERYPEAGAIFNQSRPEARFPALVAAYDFTSIGILVDVGGGTGQLLSTVLPHCPALRGVLFDLPQVVAAAGPVLEAAGVDDRCELIGGSFFEAVPTGGDAYMLAGILHDWGDQDAAVILHRCRQAMKAGSRLLVLELVMPPGVASLELTTVDLFMLALTAAGARQRTEAEFRALFTKAGFALSRIVLTAAGASIIEGLPI